MLNTNIWEIIIYSIISRRDVAYFVTFAVARSYH